MGSIIGGARPGGLQKCVQSSNLCALWFVLLVEMCFLSVDLCAPLCFVVRDVFDCALFFLTRGISNFNLLVLSKGRILFIKFPTHSLYAVLYLLA